MENSLEAYVEHINTCVIGIIGNCSDCIRATGNVLEIDDNLLSYEDKEFYFESQNDPTYLTFL